MTPGRSFEGKIFAAFAAAALVVGVLTFATWRLDQDADESMRWVAHTHEVMRNLAYVRSNTLQIELSTQSFRVTGDPAHLKDRDVTIEARETVLKQLRQLTADNVRQQDRWAMLRKLLDQRLQISRQVEMLRKTQGAEAANRYVATAPLLETRRRTSELLEAMEAHGTQLLQQRARDQQNTHQAMVVAAAALALTLTGLLAGTYALIRRQLREKLAIDRALSNSEKSLSTTLHSIGDAVLATDTQGRITRMNPVAERLTGWPLELARGLPIDDVFRIVHEITREPALVPVAQVLATGQPQELANHTALIARDGSECPIADSAAPIRDASGRITGVVLVFRDETRARLSARLIEEQSELLERRVEERTAQLRESENHLHGLIGHVPAFIAYVDTGQRYVYANSQYLHRFSQDAQDITGRHVREVLGEAWYAAAEPMITAALQGRRQSYDWEPFEGIWHFVNYEPRFDDQGHVQGYYILATDITERKKSEEKIRQLNTELAGHLHELENATRALRTLSAGNRIMLRATDEQQLLDDMCQAIVSMGGYEAATVWYVDDDHGEGVRAAASAGYAGYQGVQPAADREGRGPLERSEALRAALLTGQVGAQTSARDKEDKASGGKPHATMTSELVCPLRVAGRVIGALEIRDARNEPFDAEETALLSESADDLAFGIGTLRAQVERTQARETMHRMARHDALTGLPNETRFTELLLQAIDAGNRQGQMFAALQFNVERLGEINDALGFSYGDQLLREFGARLQGAIPASAHAARLRGDEFAILLPCTDRGMAVQMVREIHAAMKPSFLIADIPLDVSVHAGITFCPDHGSTPDDLYRHMDIAAGKARRANADHAVFEPSGSPKQKRHLSMVGELRRAIENGDLDLHVQPKVEMAGGRICGAEGLVRWRHPVHGSILPMEFIGLAEHTGLIKPLTEWVIEAGLRMMARWDKAGCPLPVAVNISARNLREEDFLQKVQALLSVRTAAPVRLEMEITESAVMEDAEFALKVLHGLRERGVTLYIDDFGTGYSSLGYLQKLPVEFIKIDQSFVLDMCTSRDSAAIVRSTIDLVHDLGHKVVAEGIETHEHWRQLLALGCDVGQGYFIARPMPGDDFPAWVQSFSPPAP